MRRDQAEGPPLTLDDMRAEGVHSVDVECACGHDAVINVDHLPGHLPVPEVKRLFVCKVCGAKPWRSMPHWLEREGVIGIPDTRARRGPPPRDG
jgi:hypothetical protein